MIDSFQCDSDVSTEAGQFQLNRDVRLHFRDHSLKRRYQSLAASLTFTLVLGGCAERNALNSTDTSIDPATDEWLGQWNGPEGTFLRLEGGKGKYEITIQNLDGPRTYQGTAVGARIHFDRNGEKESIRATNGTETGMKWLSDKSDCLTVRPGEGYCRD